MAVALKLSDELVEIAKPHAAAMHRSVPKQIEHWARLGKAVEENPELPVQFIKDTLLAVEDAKAGQVSDYQFRTISLLRDVDESRRYTDLRASGQETACARQKDA